MPSHMQEGLLKYDNRHEIQNRVRPDRKAPEREGDRIAGPHRGLSSFSKRDATEVCSYFRAVVGDRRFGLQA